MRITVGLAAMASLCLLAGCNRGATNNSATNAPAPAGNVPAPVENVAPPAETPAPTNTASGERRASEIAECVSGAPGNLPEGTDANAFCGCAVDKMMTGATPQREAINQCAAEMNIQLPNRE